ncbi:MAG: hypothetical protein ABI832_05215 [bacterium]
MLPLVHYAHILLGTIWLGGTLAFSLAFYPALARMPAAEAKRVFDAVAGYAGPLIGASGGLTMLLGPLRAYIGGGVTGWSDFTQPYGRMVVIAFVLVLNAQILGGRFRKGFAALMADPAAFASKAPGRVTANAAIETVLLLAVLGIMVSMGLALD